MTRPILHLPKKLKPKLHPQSEKVLHSLAVHLSGELANAIVQLPANAKGARPPKRGSRPASAIDAPQPSRRERRHRTVVIDLAQPGFLRLEQVLAIFPVSRASWYAGLGTIYPSSVRIGPRSVAWRTEDIRALVANPPAFDHR